MMISVDQNRCKKCGVCITRMKGYCISESEGFPVFDAALCNTCQKCVSICPYQAITVNGVHPTQITSASALDKSKVFSLLERRRSIKKFRKTAIPTEELELILSCASFAPNQNKNLTVNVFSDAISIQEIQKSAAGFVKRFYRLLFGFPVLTLFVSLFMPGLKTIKKKMEYGLDKDTLPENTQVVIVVSGDRRIPVTESSAHYVLAAMMFFAESTGIGSCLMDSVYLALRLDGKARKLLGIEKDVLGAMVLGYSDDNIVNIPKGCEVPIKWKR